MVRVGTLPSRLLALKYGADLVYTEELIDHKMVECKREENKLLGTVDFVLPDRTVVLRTCPEERDKVVFQMGTSDPDRALKTARLVCNDVAGIDVNMGCPKPFSLKGGMGSALLTQPAKVKSILTTLVKGVPEVPITCKIRLLPDKADTMALIKMIQSTGVAAIGVHGRLQQQRSREPITDTHQTWMREIASTSPIPIIANGGSLDIKSGNEIDEFKEAVGCHSVMVARAAQWNMSVFRKEGPLPIKEVAKELLKLSVRYDNEWSNTKYCLMMYLHNQQLANIGADIHQCKGLKELCEVWECPEVYDSGITERRAEATRKGINISTMDYDEMTGRASKRPRVERIDNRDVTVLDIMYDRRKFTVGDSPKGLLMNYCTKTQREKPIYTMEGVGKHFVATVEVDKERYRSTIAAPNKKKAEQTAALVWYLSSGLMLNPDGSERTSKYVRPSDEFVIRP